MLNLEFFKTRPVLSRVCALWAQGLSEGDPRPCVYLAPDQAAALRAEVPGAQGAAGVAEVAGREGGALLGLSPACLLVESPRLAPGQIVYRLPLPPFAWSSVIKLPPDPPPPDPSYRMPHPLDALPAYALVKGADK